VMNFKLLFYHRWRRQLIRSVSVMWSWLCIQRLIVLIVTHALSLEWTLLCNSPLHNLQLSSIKYKMANTAYGPTLVNVVSLTAHGFLRVLFYSEHVENWHSNIVRT